jgi:hypothetical protein
LGEIIRRRVIRFSIERCKDREDERVNVMDVLRIAILKIIGVLLRGLFLVLIRNFMFDGQLKILIGV